MRSRDPFGAVLRGLDYHECPVHGRIVAFVNGVRVGVCDECIKEAAVGLKRLRVIDVRKAARV